jgi:hypothetical protein
MRTLAIAALICLIAAPAFAGDNPNVRAYISFDPAGDPEVNTTAPAAYTTVNAYLCLDNIEGGMTTLSFRLNDAMTECPGVMATQSFVNMLPGNLMIGDPFDAVGATVASTECMTSNPVIVGYGTYFYLGGDCCIQLLDHADYARWVVDCNEPGLVDYYCVLTHGAVGAAQCPPGDCPEPGVPDVVVCEPQGGQNPTHPPTYWYDVTPGSVPLHDFHVQVYDPTFANYTAIVDPPGWTHLPYIYSDGTSLWFCWCDPELDNGLPVGVTQRFQFDHPGFSEWAGWVTTADGLCDPATGIVDMSAEHSSEPNGYGYLVHSPLPYSPVEQSSWGNIKAMYR